MGGRIIMEMLGQNTCKILTVCEISPGKLSFDIQDQTTNQTAEITVDTQDFVILLNRLIECRHSSLNPKNKVLLEQLKNYK